MIDKLSGIREQIDYGANALSAPVTPGKRLPSVDKSKVDPQLRKAAEGMEAMFLDYLMKTMRQTVPKNEMDLESPATQIYQGMMDTDTAQKAAHAGGVGLADQIIAYMEAQRYNLEKGHDVPRVAQSQSKVRESVANVNGGTDENRPIRK